MRRAPSEHPTLVVQPTDERTREETATPTFMGPSSADVQALPEGDRVAGRYVVEGVLGRGGFGEVYRVRDEQRNGEVVALKLHRLGSSNRHALRALEGEFELLAQLAHPNLARVYDFGHVGDHAAYFTEGLVAGARLDHTDLRPDDPAAMPLWTQLCRALEYLHSRGILHRDLKPSNVLVDMSAGQLTLLDFGVARMFGPSEAMRLIGTTSFLAPESIAGGPIDARADLYALGVTFYQLAAGRLPFRGSREEVIEAHVLSDPPPLDPTVVKPAVIDVIMRLLRKEPGERYASAAELLDALSRANGVSVPERPREELASYVLSARFVGSGETLLDGLVRRAVLGGAGEERGSCGTVPTYLPRGRGAPAEGGSGDPAVNTVVIEGEAGSGKSRLLREARQRVQLAGRSWVEVPRQHWTADRPLLLDVARSVITKSVAAQLDDDDRRSLSRALPELRRKRERIADPLDPERERDERHRALARAVALRFAHVPGVLAIEDLHWAAGETHEALARFVPHLRREGARCLVVVTARAGEGTASLAQHLDAEVLSCPPLEPPDSARLVESMFGQADLLDATELGAALRREAHPALYVQESLRLALERGAIVRRDGRWVVAGEVPAAPLGEVLEARVRHLGQASRRLALAVSVLGGRGTGAEIAAVSGQPLRRSGGAFRQLVRAGLLDEQREADGAVGYTMHDRFMDVVLALATVDERRAAHRRAGRVLRRVARQDWRSLLPAADHFAQAGETARAVALAERAAAEALSHGHPQMALAAYEREIALREEAGEETPIALLLARFDVALRSGERVAVGEALSALARGRPRSTARETAEIDYRDARARARHGDLAGARPRCEDALARARALGDRSLEGELLVLRAEMCEENGEIQRSLDSFMEASELAMTRASVHDEARARVGATLAALRRGDTAAAHANAQRALAILPAKEEPLLRSEALRAIGNVRRERGDVAGALRSYRRAVRAARDAGSAELEGKALNNLGTVAQWAGSVAEAEEALLRAIRVKRRIGARASSFLSEINLGSLLLCTARLSDAYAMLEPFATMETGPAVVLTLAQSNLGDVLTSVGRYDEALVFYRRAWETSTESAMVQQASHAACGLVRALIMRAGPGDMDEARALMVPFEHMHAGSGLIESVRRFHSTAAMMADAAGDLERAVGHARAARSSEEERRLCFTDVFGTTIEVRWMDAILTARAGKEKGARRKAELVRKALERLSRNIRSDEARARFLDGLPVHRAIMRGDVSTRPGWTYQPEDIRPLT